MHAHHPTHSVWQAFHQSFELHFEQLCGEFAVRFVKLYGKLVYLYPVGKLAQVGNDGLLYVR